MDLIDAPTPHAARRLDAEVDIGAVPMPAQVGLSMDLFDAAMHSWDIARATGQAADLPDELAATVLCVCQRFVTDEIRTFAGFDPAVPGVKCHRDTRPQP